MAFLITSSSCGARDPNAQPSDLSPSGAAEQGVRTPSLLILAQVVLRSKGSTSHAQPSYLSSRSRPWPGTSLQIGRPEGSNFSGARFSISWTLRPTGTARVGLEETGGSNPSGAHLGGVERGACGVLLLAHVQFDERFKRAVDRVGRRVPDSDDRAAKGTGASVRRQSRGLEQAHATVGVAALEHERRADELGADGAEWVGRSWRRGDRRLGRMF